MQDVSSVIVMQLKNLITFAKRMENSNKKQSTLPDFFKKKMWRSDFLDGEMAGITQFLNLCCIYCLLSLFNTFFMLLFINYIAK